jgi:Reverse transcriptase (RNA-dependent DNA polymerase)
MLENYIYKFVLGNGRKVFVPSEFSRQTGASVHKEVLRHWRPPKYFYHFQSGGHIAALKTHLADPMFAMLDISGFFDSVTRSKIHRALRKIRIDHRRAWQIACESTVEKTKKKSDFSLPYGFVQSPILASLALHYSALGRKLRVVARSNRARVSSYMDDIILSGVDEETVVSARSELIDAAHMSGFEINHTKSQSTGPRITAFNIVLSCGSMLVTDDRMTKFEDDVLQLEDPAVRAIFSYVRGVNSTQEESLRRLPLTVRRSRCPGAAKEIALGQ